MARMLTPDLRPVDVADEQVQEVFLGGAAGFAPGEQVPVLAPDGTPGYVPAEDAGQAFQAGYRYDPASVKEEELQQRYGGTGEQLKTGAESFLSGATLGLSTLAETRLFGVKPEDIAGRREANPLTAGGFEAGGMLVPLLVPGGQVGLAARAVRAVSAPMLGVVKAGRATEAVVRALAPKGTSAMSKVIAKTLPVTAGSAVEGALFGLGQVLDETALHRDGDAELTAEHVLGTLGTGALLGGAVGVGVKGLAALGRAIPGREAAGKIAQRIMGGKGAREKEFREMLLRKEAQASAEAGAVAGTESELTGTLTRAAGETPDAAAIAAGVTAPGAAAAAGAEGEGLMAHPGVLNAILRTGAPLDGALPLVTRSRAIQGQWDALSRNPATADTMRQATDKFLGGLDDHWNRTLGRIGNHEAGREAVGVAARSAIKDVAETASKAQGRLETQWRGAMGPGGTRVSAPATLAYLEPFVVRAKAGAEAGSDVLPGPFGRLYKAITSGEGTLDLDFARAERTLAGRNGGLGQVIHDAGPGEWDGLFAALTRDFDAASAAQGGPAKGLWGEVNRNWQHWKGQEGLLRQVANAPDGLAAFRAIFQRDARALSRWRVLSDALPEGEWNNLVATHLRELSIDPKTGRLSLSAWTSNWGKLAPEMRDALVSAPAGAPAAAEATAGRIMVGGAAEPIEGIARAGAGGARQSLEDMFMIGQAARDANYLKNFSNTASATLFQDQLTGGGTATLLEALRSPQSLTGQARTWAVNKFGQRLYVMPEEQARMLTDPEYLGFALRSPAARKLADLEAVVQKSDNRLSAALKAITARPFFSRTPIVGAAVSGFRERNETPLEAYRRHWGELQHLQASPEELTRRMAESVGDLPGVAPDTAFLMQAKAAAAVQYLTEIAPSNPAGVDDPFFGRPWEPREQDVLRWARAWDAANDPIGVIEAMADGRLTREGVDTLRTLYPKLYELAKRRVLEQLAEGAQQRKERLPYAARVQLSLLFGEPLDSSMRPEAIMASQARFQKGEGNDAGGAGGQGAGQGQTATGPAGARPPRQSKKLWTAQHTQTDTQRLASRE